jgi:hypothetical protein
MSDGHLCVKGDIAKDKSVGDFRTILTYNIISQYKAEFVIHIWTGTYDYSPHIQRLDLLKRLGFREYGECIYTKYKCYYYILGTVDRNRSGIDKFSENQIFHSSFEKFSDNLQNIFEKMRELDIILHNSNIKLPYENMEINRIELKDNRTEMTFDSGQNYDIYKNIKEILKQAKKEILIVDGYPDDTLFELYLDEIPNKIPIKFLTNKPQGKFLTVGSLFKKQPEKIFDVRTNDIHDRAIFVDDEAWIIGASLKDAGNKPTYLLKMKDKNLIYSVYINLFNNGKTLI